MLAVRRMLSEMSSTWQATKVTRNASIPLSGQTPLFKPQAGRKKNTHIYQSKANKTTVQQQVGLLRNAAGKPLLANGGRSARCAAPGRRTAPGRAHTAPACPQGPAGSNSQSPLVKAGPTHHLSAPGAPTCREDFFLLPRPKLMPRHGRAAGRSGRQHSSTKRQLPLCSFPALTL